MTPQDQLTRPRSDQQIDLDSAIEQLRTKFKVPQIVVDRMVNQESGGNTSAVSPVGARGRFQVMPDTLNTINKQTGKNLDNSNPLDNAYAGLYLLKQNYDKFRQGAPSERGAWMRAVAAYHAGAGDVQKDLANGGMGIPDVGDGLINTRDHVFNIFEGTKPEDFRSSGQQSPKRPSYETSLTPQEETQFQTWKRQYAPNDSGADYDLRGAFKAGLTPDPKTGHWPDTFKKPNHPTFSNESMYAVGADAAKAGHWEGDRFIPAQVQTQPDKSRQVAQTSVVLGEGAIDETVKPEPIKFTPADSSESNLNRLAQGSQNLAEMVRTQGVQLPANHPDLLGKHIEARFTQQPTAEQVDDALLEKLGKGYGDVARRFREEMGVPLTNGAAVERQADGSFIAHARPTQGFIDAVNAYALGGRQAYEATLNSQTAGKAAVARDMKAALRSGEGVAQDIGQAGSREMLKTAQFGQNLADLARLKSPESDPNAQAIARAATTIPQPTTWAGSGAEAGFGTLGAINRAEALGGGAAFPVSQAIEAAHRGPEAAYKAAILTAPLMAMGPIGKAVGADELSAVERQALLRGVGAGGLAASTAAGGGSPRDIAGSALTGAAFPVGAREGNPDVPMDIAAREAKTLGVERAQTVPDFQREIAAREASVNSLPSPRGVKVRAQLRGVQPAEISTTPTRPLAIEQVPESLGVVGPTKPVIPVEEGARLNRWQHRDFGLVTESASQSGVARGKVRVLAEDGSEHVIQRPNMRGEGNQIAVPVRPKPIDAQAEDAAAQAAENAPFKVLDRRGTNAGTNIPDRIAGPVSRAEPERLPRTQEPSIAREVQSPVVERPESLNPDVAGTLGAQERPMAERPAVKPEGLGTSEATTLRVGQRSFPQTLEHAGLQGGTDRDYTVVTNPEALQRATQRIETDGADRAASDLAAKKDIGADDTATGILLIRKLQDEGKLEKAVDVANDLSRKLTQAGQATQAASIVSRLSPEGVLLAAQKQLRPEQKLTRGQAQALTTQAKAVERAESRVAETEKAMQDSGALPVTESAAKQRIGNLQERLTRMEQDARARLDARKAQMIAATKGPRGQRGAAANPAAVALDIGDYAVIGAAKIARKGIDYGQWTAEMLKDFGDDIKPHLRKIYADSYRLYDDQRKQFLQESRTRGALKAQPDAKNIQAVINDRLDAQTAARKARADLARTFRDLTATPLQKVGRTIVDVTGLTRALTTTADLSFGFRQGKMGLARHPRIWLDAFAKQFQALNTKQYERLVSQLETDPDYKYARRFGLDLTSVGSSEHAPLGVREEAFQSRFVEKLPIVKHSEQAYSTMADHLRMGWFKDYANNLRKLGLDPDNPKDRPAFEEGVSLINNATGRGSLGRLQSASPALATVAFSPRFWASRVKMLSLPLDPRTYTTMSRPARVEAFKTLFTYGALVSSQLALAKASGAEVDTDPNSPDFLKARWGKLHVDFSAGFQSHIRVALRLMRAFYDRQQGRPSKTEPIDVLEHYARGKESPNFSLIHDLFLSKKTKVGGETYGTDFKGAPTSLLGVPGNRRDTSALANRLTPMVISDASDAYDQSGLAGAAETLPLSIIGEGVTTYDPKKRRGH